MEQQVGESVAVDDRLQLGGQQTGEEVTTLDGRQTGVYKGGKILVK